MDMVESQQEAKTRAASSSDSGGSQNWDVLHCGVVTFYLAGYKYNKKADMSQQQSYTRKSRLTTSKKKRFGFNG
jgi:hypothetical protein